MVEMTIASGIIAAAIVVAAAIIVWVSRQLRGRIPLSFADDMGTSCILKTKNVEKAYRAFMELKKKQSADGMVISRRYPERLSQKYDLEDSEFLWLSFEKTKDSIDPSDLEKLEFLIHEFVTSHEGALILLDGIEYLILQNSFESTLKFLQSSNDLIILNKAMLIIPLDPTSLDRKELSLIERELETYQVDYRLMRFFE